MIYVDLQQSTFYIVLFKSLLKTQVYLSLYLRLFWGVVWSSFLQG